jgi:ribosomal 30S subunit maturation factor RimM
VLVIRDGAELRRLPMVRAFVERVDLASGVVVVRPWEEA